MVDRVGVDRFRLRRLCAGAAAIVLAAAAPLWAAEPSKPGKGGQEYVDMAPVGVPVISHGRLVNYVFVTLRLSVRPGADVMRIRAKEPYFRDALVRLGHRAPLNPPSDLTRVDEAVVTTRMMAEIAAVVGPGQVSAVHVLTETPQRRTGLPPP